MTTRGEVVSAETLCECCLHCYRNGQNRHAPAAYIWTCEPSGYEAVLCVECTAIWRANAVGDPSLTPSRIRSIGVAA